MRRDKFVVSVPRERIVTRDYWELLQLEPEDRIEFTNRFFYKDLTVNRKTAAKQIKKHIQLRFDGWYVYEVVHLRTKDGMVVFRLMKVVSYATEIRPGVNASVFEESLFSSIGDTSFSSRTTYDMYRELDPKTFNRDDFLNDSEPTVRHDDFSSPNNYSEIDREDMALMDKILRANDRRVRDRIKGVKVYEEHELLGKDRCSIGAFSFITKHCNGAVYRDGICYGHWMNKQDKRPGYNPGLPYESLHTTRRPYIMPPDYDIIFAKMKDYVEALKDPTPAYVTPKKPRCKHMLHADECSICLKRPSVKPNSIDGLPMDTDTFMVFNY